MVESAAHEIVFHKDCDTPRDKDVPNFSSHRSLQLSSAKAVTYAEWSVRIGHVLQGGWSARVKQCPYGNAFLSSLLPVCLYLLPGLVFLWARWERLSCSTRQEGKAMDSFMSQSDTMGYSSSTPSFPSSANAETTAGLHAAPLPPLPPTAPSVPSSATEGTHEGSQSRKRKEPSNKSKMWHERMLLRKTLRQEGAAQVATALFTLLKSHQPEQDFGSYLFGVWTSYFTGISKSLVEFSSLLFQKPCLEIELHFCSEKK
ncbi:hypothetical protein ACLB2K_074513 [Fragaria x ananassa]